MATVSIGQRITQQASAETTHTEWCISTNCFLISRHIYHRRVLWFFAASSQKDSPSDRAGCLMVRLGGIHLNSPADWESEITHTLSPYPYLCSTWEQPNWFDSKLLKITFLLYELRSSNFGGIPAFNIQIFISAVRKRNHGVSSEATATRSCVH